MRVVFKALFCFSFFPLLFFVITNGSYETFGDQGFEKTDLNKNLQQERGRTAKSQVKGSVVVEVWDWVPDGNGLELCVRATNVEPRLEAQEDEGSNTGANWAMDMKYIKDFVSVSSNWSNLLRK